MPTPKAPVFIDKHGDLTAFRSTREAELHVEAFDVARHEYTAYDADGNRLHLKAKGNSVLITLPNDSQPQRAELETVLRGWLSRTGDLTAENRGMEFDELVRYTARRAGIPDTPLGSHLFSLLALPFVVVVVIPYFLLTGLAAYDTRWGDGPGTWLPAGMGLVVGLGGLALFGWCVWLFAVVGKGTLAPWSPTRRLVVIGPYQYVRNPMISAVAAMLLGMALYWGSWIVEVWAILFMLINHIYFVRFEEPGLEQRFGDAYRRYKANVPRWIARLTPWTGGR